MPFNQRSLIPWEAWCPGGPKIPKKLKKKNSLHVDKKKFLIVNIIDFQNVDKPSGVGVGQCG